MAEQKARGRWGKIREDYLMEYKPEQYQELVESGQLDDYLKKLDDEIWDMYNRMIDEQVLRLDIDYEGPGQRPYLERMQKINSIEASVREFIVYGILSV